MVMTILVITRDVISLKDLKINQKKEENFVKMLTPYLLQFDVKSAGHWNSLMQNH